MARFKCRHAGDWGYENGAQFIHAEYDGAGGMVMLQALWAQQYAPQPDQSGWLDPYQLPLPVALLRSGHRMPMDQRSVDVHREQGEHTPHLADVGLGIPIHTFSNFLPRANVRWCSDVDREQAQHALENAQKKIQRLEKKLQWEAKMRDDSCLMSQTAISVLEEQVQDLQSAIEILIWETEHLASFSLDEARKHRKSTDSQCSSGSDSSDSSIDGAGSEVGTCVPDDRVQCVAKLGDMETAMAELRCDNDVLRRECMELTKRNDALTLKLEVLERERSRHEPKLPPGRAFRPPRPPPEVLEQELRNERRKLPLERCCKAEPPLAGPCDAEEGALPTAAVLPWLPIGPDSDVERLPCGPGAPPGMRGAALSPGRRRRRDAQDADGHACIDEGRLSISSTSSQSKSTADAACQTVGLRRRPKALEGVEEPVATEGALCPARSTADGEDCTVGPQPRPKALEGIEVCVGECSPHDLHVPNLLPFLSVQELMSWRLVSRRTRSPEALLNHLEEMGSMDRPSSVVAFAEKVVVFASNPETSFAAAFGGDAKQQKLYECRWWCMALASKRRTHFAESDVEHIVGKNLESLHRHCLSADAAVATAASLVAANYSGHALAFMQRPIGKAMIALLEDLVESDIPTNMGRIGYCVQTLTNVLHSLCKLQRQKWVSLMVKLLMDESAPKERVIRPLKMIWLVDDNPAETYRESIQQLRSLVKTAHGEVQCDLQLLIHGICG
ncbi:unnamed protein product [Symbiodinium sp. CCMP2592]|nr:unnamed protein product [Symbiodinium sp. CCMP2592]